MHVALSDERLGLAVLYDGDLSQFPLGPLVDIVAVHGIGADPDRTWTRDGVNWLRDEEMLPLAVPQARIMRFGYESQWLGREAIQQRLPLVADQLLHSLTSSRKTCPNRPLVFLGHCFGGLVIEKAVLSAKLHEDDYPGVASSTAGVVCLGTPHRGSNSQSKASMIATIASMVGVGEKSQVLQSVEKDSGVLTDMIHDFTRFVNASSIPVFCFFEQHKSDAARLFRPKGAHVWPSYKEVIVDEYSASLDGYPKLGLASDHFQMNCFGGNQDSNYRYVCEEILRIVQSAPDRMSGRSRATPQVPLSSEIQTMQDQSCLQALFITNPLDDMKMIENKRDHVMEHSASWILHDASFQTWLNTDGSSLLWLHGDPGKGKTMLAISLVQEFDSKIRLNSSDGQTISTYFFCDNKDDRRKNATSILRGIIYQALTQMPELCIYFRTEYEKQKEHLLSSPNTLQALWRIFQNILSHPTLERVYVVVDALDECDLESADDFLALLEPYTRPAECTVDHAETSLKHTSCNVKILLTSRNEVAIKQRLFESLEISMEHNSVSVNHAVHAYVNMKVQHLQRQKRYDEKLKAFVEEQLLEKAQGTFLWAALACRELSKPAVRLLQTKTVLQKLPPGLMPLYDRIMDQILSGEDEESQDHAKAILRAMVVAQRPYTLEELAVVTDLPEEYHHETAVLEDHVDTLCGSMVDIRNGSVYFVHASARDYILTTKNILSNPLSLDHQTVAVHCFRHLCSYQAEHAGELLRLNRKASMIYDRLEYPVLYWLDHVKSSPKSISDEIYPNHPFFQPHSKLGGDWFNAFWQKRHAQWEERPSSFAGLHLAGYADIPWLVSALLSAGTPIDTTDSLGNTPLIWAARMGSEKSVAELLAKGADIAVSNCAGVSALFLAAAHGHRNIVQLLANGGASLSVTDRLGWTPLHRAADQGHTDVVLCLLQNGAPIEAKDGGTWTALYRAVSSGQVAVIKILMDHNADAEVPDREGMTLLHTAAWNGHEDVVFTLLRYFKDVNARDREGWTALHHAAWNGHARVVNLLAQNNAEPDSKNLEGNTSLYHAAWNGHTKAVQVLLQHGADVNEVCADAETALQQAAWRGHSSIVQVLLKAGADPNAQNKSGSTALHQAASNGQDAIVQLLLDSGADVLLKTEDGQTAYEAAKENSYYELARCLESRGGHVAGEENESEVDGMTERRTGLDVDNAIAEILGIDRDLLVMQDHGDACSSEPFKITAIMGRQKRYFFVKLGPNEEMFKGEHASLQALHAVTPSICPLSLGFGKLSVSPSKCFLLTDFLDVNAQTNATGSGLSFAQKLAMLHSAPVAPPEGHNQAMFGFPITTYTGRTKQDNTFRRSWAKFYAENRLRTISKLIEQAHGTDDELRLWIERTAAETVPKLLGNGHLGGKRGISPVLVHGDLWSGNKARGQLGGKGGIEDVAFDASCCYAHSEYDLGLMRMFGGFSAGFFSEYHRLIPKTSPQNEYEDRMKLYQVYHWLNNWLLFRGGYRDDAMDCMQELYAKYGDGESEEES